MSAAATDPPSLKPREGQGAPAAAGRVTRVRMTGIERREQLRVVAREVFAERGFEATSIEEIAHRAGVSKPVIYEHFSSKEGLYAVVVDREVAALVERITAALSQDDPRQQLEQAALALLTYVQTETDGFRVLIRDSPVACGAGTFSSLLMDIARQVEHILGRQFASHSLDPGLAALYSQALVGMVALVGQWWLQAQEPDRDVVAAHLVQLAWRGLSGLQPAPTLRRGA